MSQTREISEDEARLIRGRLSYSPDTGQFSHAVEKIGRYGRILPGDKVRLSRDAKGYLRISMLDRVYAAHRLAWFFINGDRPLDMVVDHIDHNKENNAISNLRLVTKSGNQKNRSLQANNTSGTIGVCFAKSKQLWMAYYCDNGKRTIIGTFKSQEEAVSARRAINEDYGFHINHGSPKPEVTLNV